MPQWDPFSYPIDTLLVDMAPSPGIATLTRIDRVLRLRKLEPYGVVGARVISLGRYLYEFSFRFLLVTKEDWDTWNTLFRPALERIPIGARNTALLLTHPALAERGIVYGLAEKIRGPIPDGDEGNWVIDVDFIEWIAMPKRALAAPKTPPKTPLDPYDALIEGGAKLLSSDQGGRLNRLGDAAAEAMASSIAAQNAETKK